MRGDWDPSREPWRAPTLMEDDELIYDEPGRVMERIDYRSHWFRLVKPRFGFYTLLVKHGGGEDRVLVDHSRMIVSSLAALDSTQRYYLLHTLYKAASENRRQGAAEATARMREAFAEGRLKKRKMPGRDAFKVWVEPKPVKTTTEAA